MDQGGPKAKGNPMKALTLVLALSLFSGCASVGFQHTSASTTLASETRAAEVQDVCNHAPAHLTRRAHEGVVVDGVTYLCF